ncbi:MAG: RnfABCDGE type electron transport complex subunit D [Eubacteriales bacterium]|nr:RnfABCDGE type electron transport complex subunit D [Eubacteriales bacterium]
MMLRLSGAPHLVTRKDTRAIMLLVLAALLPTTVAGVYYFGWNALMLIAVSCVSAVGSEWLWQKLAKKPVRIGDFSALVTGLILALNLPSTAPWWIALIGSVFAIIVVKQLYGGIGHNFMNPAMAARAMLLASWPARMTTWVLPSGFGAADAVSSATALAGEQFSKLDLFLGNVPGTIGEVCKVAILAGFVLLLCTDVIKWRIPVVFVGVTALCSWAFGSGSFNFTGDPLAAVLSGGVLFGAVFMATDYTTCPMTATGQFIYAAGCGLIVSVIRAFGAYPEGVTYAILLMNIATPLIDKFTRHKIYGEVKANGKGK